MIKQFYFLQFNLAEVNKVPSIAMYDYKEFN